MDRGDFNLLQPLLKTRSLVVGTQADTRCSACNIARWKSPRFNAEAISHSRRWPMRLKSLATIRLVTPGQFLDMCAANTPAYPTMIPEATSAPPLEGGAPPRGWAVGQSHPLGNRARRGRDSPPDNPHQPSSSSAIPR